MTSQSTTSIKSQKLTIFVAHSFASNDAAVVTFIERTIKRAGFSVLSGRQRDTKGVGQKIQERIGKADLFVALLTRRWPIRNNKYWTTAPWVVEEKGFSIGQNPRRPIILLVEDGIEVPTETGGLEGDLEYINFNRYQLDIAKKELRDLLSKKKEKLEAIE
jgi:hypothetical protein